MATAPDAAAAALTSLGDFAPLPAPVSLTILSLLPMPDLLRCAGVSHAFHALTRAPELWRCVALAPTLAAAGCDASDQRAAARPSAVVRGLLRFAGDVIEHLDADGCACFNTAALLELLSTAAAQQRTAGRALRLSSLSAVGRGLSEGSCFTELDAAALLASAQPQLQRLHVDLYVTSPTHAPHIFSTGVLSVHTVVLKAPNTPHGGDPVWPVQRVTQLLSLIAQHTQLRSLLLIGLYDYVDDGNKVFDALLQALTALPSVESLWLGDCWLPVPQIAACVRALGARLKTLIVDDQLIENWASPGALEFRDLADALANSALETLHLSEFKLHESSLPYCRRLLEGLRMHTTLRELTLTGMHGVHDELFGSLAACHAVCAVIADIITADAPALQHMHFCDSPARNGNFDDYFLPSIVAALAHNTHLRTVTVSALYVSHAFLSGPLHDAVEASNELRRQRAAQPGGAPCVLLLLVVQPA
jgi:hypothetical protein